MQRSESILPDLADSLVFNLRVFKHTSRRTIARVWAELFYYKN